MQAIVNSPTGSDSSPAVVPPPADSRLAWMAHSLTQAGLPYAWWEPHTLEFGHINPAMQQLLQRQQAFSGLTPAQCVAQLQAAAAQCLASGHTQQLHWPQSHTYCVFEPVPDAQGGTLAIQCVVRQEQDQQVQRLEQVLNQLPVGLWMSKPSGEFFWVNPQNPAYRADAPDYLASGAWYARIPPEDVIKASSSFVQAALLGKVDPYEYRMQLEDGQLNWFYVDGGPVRMGAVA